MTLLEKSERTQDLLFDAFGDGYMLIGDIEIGKPDFFALIEGALYAFIMLRNAEEADDAHARNAELIKMLDDAGGRAALVHDPEQFVNWMKGGE